MEQARREPLLSAATDVWSWAATVRQVHPAILDGIDPAHILAEYEPLLAHVASHAELLDLMNEMQSELGVSHAGVYPPEASDATGEDEDDGQQGFLGLDTEWDESLRGWRIVGQCHGDVWVPKDAAPMTRAKAQAVQGELVVAINQRRLTKTLSPEVALRRLAGKEISVTLRRSEAAGPGGAGDGGPGGKGRAPPTKRVGGGKKKAEHGGGAKPSMERSVRVRVGTVAQIRRARYLDWVGTRRDMVATGCAGRPSLRVGYVHISDMEESGYADFAKQFLAECRPGVAALILDLRGNCGGYTSDLILTRLTQRRMGRELGAHGHPGSIPELAAPSSLVVLIDEGTSSDSELLAHTLQHAAGAVLVGSRTWGGVVSMGETDLVDGTTVSHPSFLVRLDHGTLPLEGRGVLPARPVAATPHDAIQGHDRQLEAAVDEALKLAEANAVAVGDSEEEDSHNTLVLQRDHPHWSQLAEPEADS